VPTSQRTAHTSQSVVQTVNPAEITTGRDLQTMSRLRSRHLLTWFTTVLILLIVSSLFIRSGEHTKAIEKAKQWHQSSVCEPPTEMVVTGAKTEIKREELVDRYHNRIACDLCQPGDVFCETVG
jgi:hypothetical protein